MAEQVKIEVPVEVHMNHCSACDIRFILLGVLSDSGMEDEYGYSIKRGIDWCHHVGPDIYCPYCGQKETT